MSRRARLVFTLSVILNLLFLGAGIGVATHVPRDPMFPREMNPKARAFMKETFRAGRGEIAPMIDEIKARRAAVETVLTAPDFDRAAYDSAAGRMLDTRDRMSRKRAEIMGRALGSVSAEDRRDYARYILDGLEGRPKPPRPKGEAACDGAGGPGGNPPPKP